MNHPVVPLLFVAFIVLPQVLWLAQFRQTPPAERLRFAAFSLLCPIVVWTPLIAVQAWCITGSGWSCQPVGEIHATFVIAWFCGPMWM